MITSVDTNIISSIWLRGPEAHDLGVLLHRLSEDGALVVCGPVWVELAAGPGSNRRKATEWLAELGIRVEYNLSQPTWDLAADFYHDYVERRRAEKSGLPRRLVTDFLVGAHAIRHADRFCTADARFYRSTFPKLTLVKLPPAMRLH